MIEAVALLCRTSERNAETTGAVRELGDELGARMTGEPSAAHDGQWADDLEESRGCVSQAARIVGDSLDAGRRPLLVAGHCAVCMGTLPAVAVCRPDVAVVWLDAHADFNSPDTTLSGFLGGMCLAGACGVWDAGLEAAAFPPDRVHMVGVRDLDPGEATLVSEHGVARGLPAGGEVFVHLDLDVLDPTEHPADFPAPGGMTYAELYGALEQLAARCDVVGIEVTGPAPGHGWRIADTLAPLL